jgi:hypothetical protein
MESGMTTVAISFTQATVDTLTAYRAASAAQASAPTLGRQFDQLIDAGYDFSANHFYYNDILLQAPVGWLTFPDGAYQYFTGMTMTGTTSGAITATRLEDYVPDDYALVYEGQLNFAYSNTPASGIALTNNGGTISSITRTSLRGAGDPAYDQTFGNSTLAMNGTLNSVNANQFSGNVTAITATAEHFLASTNIAGAFNVSGSSVDIGLGAASTTLTGTLASLTQTYTDGSTFTLSGPMAVTGATLIDDRILSDSSYFTGDDVINVTLPASLPSAYTVNGGDGNDRITIKGGGGQLGAAAGNGSDTIVLADHGHRVSGGAGIDLAIFSGQRSAYAVAASTSATGDSVVSAIGGAADTLSGVERIRFDDASVALDINGNAGQAYRLYQAAYNRTPDAAGLGYWIKQMDIGLSQLDMARNFSASAEFQALYGVVPSNADLVNSFYRNALHREAEPAGFAYWLDVLDRKLVSAPDLLAMFSDSAENQAAVLPAIITGIGYTPYG